MVPLKLEKYFLVVFRVLYTKIIVFGDIFLYYGVFYKSVSSILSNTILDNTFGKGH